MQCALWHHLVETPHWHSLFFFGAVLNTTHPKDVRFPRVSLYFTLIMPVGYYTDFTNRELREDNFDPIKALESFYVLLTDVACTCRRDCERNCIVVYENNFEGF